MGDIAEACTLLGKSWELAFLCEHFVGGLCLHAMECSRVSPGWGTISEGSWQGFFTQSMCSQSLCVRRFRCALDWTARISFMTLGRRVFHYVVPSLITSKRNQASSPVPHH